MQMAFPRAFDIVVAGGGIAGSCFAGVMARAGLGVLLVEREAQYRDRVRGEATWPWGVAEAKRCGLLEVYRRADAIDIVGVGRYAEQTRISEYRWEEDSIEQLPEMGFVHTRMQQAAFDWAIEQGVTPLRPAKVESVRPGGRPSATIQRDDGVLEVDARLVVGADGKQSGVRKFTGGELRADPERCRFGGVLLTGVEWEVYTDDFEGYPGRAVNWFPISAEHTRLYLAMPAEELQRTGVAQSFEALLKVASSGSPDGRFDGAVQAGPIAFFPNSDVWTTRISGEGVTLIGDAAGSVDPSQGHGTSLLMRDVRELSEALLDDSDWQRAIEGYAARRSDYFEVLHTYDDWCTQLSQGMGIEADRAREGNARAEAADPTLGGWNQIEARGPDGLTPNDAARRHYFGADI